MIQSFDQLPDEARIWIYQSNRLFQQSEIDLINNQLSEFIDSWTCHGSNMSASWTILHNLFLVIGADENVSQASGCSIDKSVKIIQDIEKELNIKLLERENIAFIKDDQIKIALKKNFKDFFTDGTISPDTFVFLNSISQKGELKTSWTKKAKDTWLKKYFSSTKVSPE